MAQFAKGDSAGINEVTAIDCFVKHFEENDEPPEDFYHGLIDVFLRVLSDPSSKLRIKASYVIVKLIFASNDSLMHTLLDKGALNSVVMCLATATETQHEGLVANCLVGVLKIAKHCDDCFKLVQGADVLEIIANKMDSGAIHTHMQCSHAIDCFEGILSTGDASMQLEASWIPYTYWPYQTGRKLISAIVNAIRRFGIDGTFYEDCLGALIFLAHRGNYVTFDGFETQFDGMLNDAGIISIAMDAIATGCPDLVSSGLGILINSLQCSDNMKENCAAYDGLMKIITDCLDSSWGTVRIRAAAVLRNLMGGAPPSRLDWFSKEVELIAQLIGLLNHRDSKLQHHVSRVFFNVLGAIVDNYEADYPSSIESYVENGVRTIVESAIKSGADMRLVNIIKGVLPTKLLAHPEFCARAQKYLQQHVNDPEPIVNVPPPNEGPEPIVDVPPHNEGIINTLISYAYAMFGMASSTEAVSEPTDGATTVPENPSAV